ncbi:MAG: hypothetical protein MI976_29460 [Pseudomonadales bacterium]|nr:hypothetical protein [Pseudomonadales bacterium]
MNETFERTDAHVHLWVASHPLSQLEVDCATAVMLKILDGKCKMKPESKVVMEILYDHTKHQTGKLLGKDIHQLIAESRGSLNETQKNHIYEKRLLAETMISRPVMKGFKSRIKKEGLLAEHIMNGIRRQQAHANDEEF